MTPAPLVVPLGISLGGSLPLGALIGSGGRAGMGAAPTVPQQLVVASSQQLSRWNQARRRASKPPPQHSSSQPQAGAAGFGAGAGACAQPVAQVSQQSS